MTLLGRLLFLLYICFSVNVTHAFDFIDDHSVDTNVIGRVCRGIDIRNAVSEFHELRYCGVIEGSLSIVLIDRANKTEFEGLQFPLLTEVTDFVVFYRVQGLKSLGQLFPNLRVIRGNSLLHGYAFIVYDMPHLQEIGLKSLTAILRGNVRIERNPQLCFADTVEWSRIASSTDRADNFVSNNRPASACPTCRDAGNSINDNNVVPPVCPELNGKNLCWNLSHCQQLCPSKCGNSTCNAKGDCCDDLCLGCDETGKCLACRHLYNVKPNQAQCVKSCPPDKFSHKNSRCITESKCRTIRSPTVVDGILLANPFIPHAGECSTDCPSNSYPFGPSLNRQCIPCVGECTKMCSPGYISGISTAQQYRGCTHVNGSLVINTKNRSSRAIFSELERSLANIEVIEGNLVIENSHPLVSLGFFKKLRLVRNNPIGMEKYGIKVVGNENLRELFMNKVVIEHGRMFFHLNPKLCITVIEKFKSDVVDLRSESCLIDDEVAPDTNGDTAECETVELHVEIERIDHDTVVMQLVPYDKERGQVIGYLINYMPVLYRNVTIYGESSRDECAGNVWEKIDFPDSDRNGTVLTITLTQLKPNTLYAYYIGTYVVANEKLVGFTKIEYFRTPVAPEHTSNFLVTTPVICEINLPSVQCAGTCKKECTAGHIYGTLTAQRYRGCTHINGQLIIHIRNGDSNTVRELEDSLANVEVIEGSLIIKQSYPLVSLGFFKNLRLVRNFYPNGNETYGIKVIGNQNLEALFLHNVTIERGRMFFHFNPKLCMQFIEELKLDVVELRNISRLSDDEVAPHSNGNEVACQIKELHVEVVSNLSFVAIIEFTPIQYVDIRKLLRYLIYYKPAKHQNVTMYDGRSACGSDGWQVEKIVGSDRRATRVQGILTKVTPDTQYAYFIRTLTVGSEIIGGSSTMKYFRTPPGPMPMVDTDDTSGSCGQSESYELHSADDAEESIRFENNLQNFAYIKRGKIIPFSSLIDINP